MDPQSLHLHPVPFAIPAEITTENSIEFPIIPTTTNPVNNDTSATQDDLLPIPSGYFFAHHYIKDGNGVYCWFDDVETSGEYAGMIQLSAELFRPSTGADGSTADFLCVSPTFN